MLNFLGVLLAIYLLYLALAVLVQRWVVFPRHLIGAPAEPPEWPDVERRWLTTEEGRTEVWLARVSGSAAGVRHPAVLFAHGNAELIDHQWVVVQGYRSMGFHVMLCEYRGYGRSTGTPSERNLSADFLRCFDMLTQTDGVDASRIIVHGRSIGTGIACAVAAQRKPAAVILRSPFISVRRMAAQFLIPPFLVLDPFDNVRALKQYGGPILILHGDRDEVIPVWHARALHQAVPNTRYIEYRGYGHNDFPEHLPRYWEDIRRFLCEVGVIQ